MIESSHHSGDDWQVVEEALLVSSKRDPAFLALARLREREAQYREEVTAKNETIAHNLGALRERVTQLNDADARVARLEEALREIADGSWGAQAQHVHYDVCEFARRALAHEERK